MATIPESHRDLLRDDERAFAVLATLNKNNTIQASPLWFNTDDDLIYINSALGRVKDRNMRARRTIALVILDPKNPYRYIQIQGKITKITEEDATAHIHALSHKYHGTDYPLRVGETRVKYEITPEKVTVMG